MAKAPLPGLAKTRLIPALGAEGAAALAARLLDHALAQAQAAALGPVLLCTTPAPDHPGWAHWTQRAGLQFSAQADGDLGQRMHQALSQALQAQPAALLVGSDIPGLDAAGLQQAAAALDHHDAVFGPTADGGYALVGLKQPQPALFIGLRWSHAQVMADARRRAAAAGLRLAELPPLHDIDEPADLLRLPPALARP